MSALVISVKDMNGDWTTMTVREVVISEPFRMRPDGKGTTVTLVPPPEKRS